MRSIHLAKLGKAIEVPEHSSFSADVQRYLEEVAMREILKSAMNDISTDGLKGEKLAAEIAKGEALAMKKLDKLIAGVVTRRVSGDASDPVAKQARQLAIGRVQKDEDFKSWVKKNAPGKAGEQAARDEMYRRAQEVAQDPQVIAVAEQMVALAATLADL